MELPASLVEGMSGPVSLLDFESRVSACLAQGRQQVSDCIISPAMQLLAKMMAQAPSNEATERLRRLGALLLRRTLRQVGETCIALPKIDDSGYGRLTMNLRCNNEKMCSTGAAILPATPASFLLAL